MNKKRILAIILILCTIFTLTVPVYADTTTAPDAANLPQTAVLVALGDSVPAHYGLPEEQGYAALLAADMKAAGADTTVTNLAVSGLTSGALLSQLQTPDAAVLADADVITVNIGGNDVLGLFVGIIKDSLTASGVTDIAEITPDILAELATTSLTADQTAQIQTGVKSFTANFPLIIAGIQKIAPDAKLIVSTVYNPFPKDSALYSSAGTILAAINAVISQSGDNYAVADTYAAFEDADSAVVNFDLAEGIVDIHPNAAGHRLIADIHMEAVAALFASADLVPAISDLTRGDAVAALVSSLESAGIAPPAEIIPFADVPEDHKNFTAIHAARTLGAINGKGDNIFAPDEIMTRQDFAVMALNIITKLTGKDAETIALLLPAAPADMASAAGYASSSVKAAIVLGIIAPDASGNINPGDPATSDLIGTLSAAVIQAG